MIVMSPGRLACHRRIRVHQSRQLVRVVREKSLRRHLGIAAERMSPGVNRCQLVPVPPTLMDEAVPADGQ